MAITKRALKTELNLPTVAIIGELLKAADRPAQGQTVEDADATMIRAAIPHWKTGKSYVEAVRLALGELREKNVEGDVSAIAPPQTPAGELTFHQKAAIQANLAAKEREAFRAGGLISAATSDAEKDEEAYWLLYTAARGSDQVQNSERVTNARDFAYQAANGQLDHDTVVEVLDTQLGEIGGFFTLTTPKHSGPNLLDTSGGLGRIFSISGSSELFGSPDGSHAE